VATKNGAQLLRAEDQYGTLEPGKKANFIVLEKDPSQDIRNTQTIRAIWKNGALVSDGPSVTTPWHYLLFWRTDSESVSRTVAPKPRMSSLRNVHGM
jgi:adenine deaminase